MSIVTLQIPEVKSMETERPHQCPYCPGETFQRWGGGVKAVRDPYLGEVWVYRYRCCRCQRTFRHYPQGVKRASQTQRTQVLVALGWIMGLSYRGLVALYCAFGLKIERMSAWRDVQVYARQLEKERHWQKVRVLGVDGAYVRGWGKTQPVLVAVDLGTGQPVTVGYVEEKDPQAVKRFLEPLVQRLGVSVIVTDDLNSYKVAARELNLEHQVCQFHVRRWVGRALRDLRLHLPPEWHALIHEVQGLIDELPPKGEKRLWQLYRQLPVNRKGRRSEDMAPLELLRHLIARLAQDWANYRVFDWQAEVPWTNNTTEQVIGRMKMRARTVRGYKNWPGMASGLMAAGVRIH